MNQNTTRLPLVTRVGYGVAEVGMSAAEVMLQLYLFYFYTSAVGLETRLAGYALGLAVLWDALVDPIMGAVSDRTPSRWGRRRPYLVVGGIALAVTTYLLFSPPQLESQAAKFVYLLLWYALVNTSMTIINVPHSALGGEMTFDRNERTELFGWRMLFKNVGFLFGAIFPALVLKWVNESGGTELNARSYASVAVAVAILCSAAMTVLAVGDYDPPYSVRKGKKIGALRQMRRFFLGLWTVACNPVFAPLLLAYMVAQLGRTVNASLALHYYKIRLGFSEEDAQFYVIGVLVIVISLSLPVWVWLSRRFGKKRPAFLGAVVMGALTIVVYPLLPPGNIPAAVIFASVVCGSLVGSIVLFDSLVADIVDYDELKSREHREGLYFGCWLMATKVARAIGLACTGVLMTMIGFDQDAATQPPEMGFRIALLYGPLVGVCFIVAAIIFLWMPLSGKRHQRVQDLLRRLQARKAARAATQP